MKSKKQEMIKKRTGDGNDAEFSEPRLAARMKTIKNQNQSILTSDFSVIPDAGQPGTEIFNMPASTTAGTLCNRTTDSH